MNSVFKGGAAMPRYEYPLKSSCPWRSMRGKKYLAPSAKKNKLYNNFPPFIPKRQKKVEAYRKHGKADWQLRMHEKA